MRTPAVTLKLKRFRRRFGISAPRVAVRPHVPWQWQVTAVIGGVALVAAIVWSVAQRGEMAGAKREMEEIRGQLAVAEDELSRLRFSSGTEQNAVQMERSAQQQLVARLKVLEAENVGLKEEIALFERLVDRKSVV